MTRGCTIRAMDQLREKLLCVERDAGEPSTVFSRADVFDENIHKFAIRVDMYIEHKAYNRILEVTGKYQKYLLKVVRESLNGDYAQFSGAFTLFATILPGLVIHVITKTPPVDQHMIDAVQNMRDAVVQIYEKGRQGRHRLQFSFYMVMEDIYNIIHEACWQAYKKDEKKDLNHKLIGIAKEACRLMDTMTRKVKLSGDPASGASTPRNGDETTECRICARCGLVRCV